MGIENIKKQEHLDKNNKDVVEYVPTKSYKEDSSNIEIAELEGKIDQMYQIQETLKGSNSERQIMILQHQHEYAIDKYDTIINKYLPHHNTSKINPNKIHAILKEGTMQEKKSLSTDFVQPTLVDIYRSIAGQFSMRGLSSLFIKAYPSKDIVALQEYYIDINNLIINASGSDQ